MTSAGKSSSKFRSRSRLRAFLVLAVAGALLVPVAISWACGPNRAVQLDRLTYSPGQTVQVSGANFEPQATVNIKLNGSTVTSTTVSGTGNISASFTAPTATGTHVVTTDGVDQNGQSLAGTGNAQTFEVVAPAQAPSGSGSGPGSEAGSGAGSSPGTSPQSPGVTAPAPGTTSGGADRARGGDNSRSVSGGERVRRGPAARRAPANAGINTTEGVITTQGTTAFAGSVPRATRAAVAAQADGRRSARAGDRAPGKTAVPSEGSAASDAWSGLGTSPALVPGPTDPGVSEETGGGSVLTWALALLGLGALVLAGLGVAEVQRRRKVPVR